MKRVGNLKIRHGDRILKVLSNKKWKSTSEIHSILLRKYRHAPSTMEIGAALKLMKPILVESKGEKRNVIKEWRLKSDI